MTSAVSEVESLCSWQATVAKCRVDMLDPTWPSDHSTKLKAMLLLVGDLYEKGSRLLSYEVSRMPSFECARSRRHRAHGSAASFVRFERPYMRRVERLQRLRVQCDYAFYLFMDLTRELISHG